MKCSVRFSWLDTCKTLPVQLDVTLGHAHPKPRPRPQRRCALAKALQRLARLPDEEHLQTRIVHHFGAPVEPMPRSKDPGQGEAGVAHRRRARHHLLESLLEVQGRKAGLQHHEVDACQVVQKERRASVVLRRMELTGRIVLLFGAFALLFRRAFSGAAVSPALCEVKLAEGQQLDGLASVLSRVLEVCLQHVDHGRVLAVKGVTQDLGGTVPDIRSGALLARRTRGMRMRRKQWRFLQLPLQEVCGSISFLLRRLGVLQRHAHPGAVHLAEEAVLRPGDGVRRAPVLREEGADREAWQRPLRRIATGSAGLFALRGGPGTPRPRTGLSAGFRCLDPCCRRGRLWRAFAIAGPGSVANHRLHDFRDRSLAAEDRQKCRRLLKVGQDGQRLLRIALQQTQLQQQEADLDGKEVIDWLDVFEKLLQDQCRLSVLPQLHAQQSLVIPQHADILVFPICVIVLLFPLLPPLVLLVALSRPVVCLRQL
mmetsp:Transcript_38620/g.111033  ORF Transcript_38620/g.111033 Transcript_38620/m.111033 type:complete len:483 (+) Transcript_38620:1686-3134(+)